MLKSEALEPKIDWTITYSYCQCPYCFQQNIIYLGDLNDLTLPDIEACRCWSCKKKFWMPGSKEIAETNAGFGLEPEDLAERGHADELGLEPEQDLIESAFCEDGKQSIL